MSQKFNVLVSEVKAAMLFASEDDSRYVLNSVHFETRPGAAPLLVSCDGRRLCVIETQALQEKDVELPELSVTLAACDLAPVCAFTKRLSDLWPLTIEVHPPERVVFQMPGLAIDIEKGAVIGTDFPKWRDVLPNGEKEPMNELGVNAELVGDFAKAAKLLKKGSLPLIRMNLFRADSAIDVRLADIPQFYGVIMPAKPATDMPWQPEFVGMPEPTKKADSQDAGSLPTGTVTIKTGEESVTVTTGQFERVCKKITGK